MTHEFARGISNPKLNLLKYKTIENARIDRIIYLTSDLLFDSFPPILCKLQPEN
jgi:hypothetical protein